MTDETNPTPDEQSERSELAELRDEIRALNERLAAPARDPRRETADQFLEQIRRLQQDQWSHGFSVFEDRG